MYCSICKTQNEDTAQFCRNCGANFYPAKAPAPASSNDISSILLLLFIVIALGTAIAQFAIQKFVEDWYGGTMRYVQGSLWILSNLSYILPALAIKNKPIKIIAIILVSFLIIYWGYSNVEFMLQKI